MIQESLLTIDFETQDPFLSKKMKLGAGWVFKYHTDTELFQVLGCSVKSNNEPARYITDFNELAHLVDSHDALIAHNASYELGILHVLNKTYPMKLKDKPIYDTLLLYKLYNNQLSGYSLDELAQKFLKIRKDQGILADIVWDNGLFPWKKSELTAKTKAEVTGTVYSRIRPKDNVLLKFAYENMALLQQHDFNKMAAYANKDAEVCYELFNYVKTKVDKSLMLKYSTLLHIITLYRLRGVRIDVYKAKELSDALVPEINKGLEQINQLTGMEVNIRSTEQLAAAFNKLKIAIPLTEKGKPSITTPWLKKQPQELCKLIVDIKAKLKLQGDFFKKIIDMQKYTCTSTDSRYGLIFPNLNILGADATGRFSSTTPNIQQIPPFVREIIVPFEGEKLFSGDFNAQEPRLQVHYAKKLGCDGIDEFILEYRKDHKFDIHKKAAALLFNIPIEEVTKEIKTPAKILNLGLSYGMGLGKLAEALGLSKDEAERMRAKYFELFPYMQQLINTTKKVMKERGYIKTLGGRIIRLETPKYKDGDERTFEYKALNALIQGSAADQTIECMIKCYQEGIPVLFPVHDELVMSGTEEQARRMKEIMETAVSLEVPSYTQICCGMNWKACK